MNLPPDGFRHLTHVEIRFGDIDSLGHVNNAKYLTYTEQARMNYWADVAGWNWDTRTLGIILARVAVDFKLPLLLSDRLDIYSRVTRIGNSSFDMEHAFIRHDKDGVPALAAVGHITLVRFDYAENKSVRLSDEWRDKVTAYEPVFSQPT